MQGTQTLSSDLNGVEPGFIHILGQDNWGVEIGDFLSLGRDSSTTLTLKDPYLSSRHARIERKEKGYLLIQLVVPIASIWAIMLFIRVGSTLSHSTKTIFPWFNKQKQILPFISRF